jgi:catalase
MKPKSTSKSGRTGRESAKSDGAPAARSSSKSAATRKSDGPSRSRPDAEDAPPACATDKNDALEAFRERPDGSTLTTDQGIPIGHTDDSLRAGQRGPTLLEDFHLREKIMRFDHERIPERVVHARGSGAHGFFQVYESLEDITAADFLIDPTAKTPVFVRFSTVVGSRGSSDLARDVRGFATRFYTRQGNFDLVGNNMPVFFIQDGIKFPDLVHAVKPEPHHEMPQAASAHDTFWDFVSLVPETMHMVMWVMSDRALPRSYRMMEGFGVHTFRLVNAKGRSVFCKFHWKPVLGAHSIVWDEAQKISGKDPDFHRRDLWEAIERGNYPEYELGLQIIPEGKELAFGFDLLDPTKLVPEELVPVRRVGKLTLDRNPSNFFAETEQVAFCVGNIVPGIDFTNDPLMQARLFSYLDTQLLRLGGPNFMDLPINRPLAAVHNHQQDGAHRMRIPTARALYHPNSIAGNQPELAPPGRGFTHFPQRVEGEKTRERSPSFLDHFSQARMFLLSQSEPEYEHLVDACRFELGKVERLAIRERVVALFAEIDEAFAQEVAEGIGVTLGKPARKPQVAASSGTPGPAKAAVAAARPSPALSLVNQPHTSIRTRKVAMLVAEGARASEIDTVRSALHIAGACVELVAPTLGFLTADNGSRITIDRSLLTTASVLYDAVFVPGGQSSVDALKDEGAAIHFVREAFLHAKPIAATTEGIELLEDAELHAIQLALDQTIVEDQGVITGRDVAHPKFATKFIDAIAKHRHFDRDFESTSA